KHLILVDGNPCNCGNTIVNHATEMKQSEYKYPCLGDTLELWGNWVRFGLYTKI
ncbi:hypothetical protein COCVIDRAFT_96226, partial [Bipolaris victoriae FI3]